MVSDALYYNMKFTPRTRMFPQLSDCGVEIMLAIDWDSLYADWHNRHVKK